MPVGPPWLPLILWNLLSNTSEENSPDSLQGRLLLSLNVNGGRKRPSIWRCMISTSRHSCSVSRLPSVADDQRVVTLAQEYFGAMADQAFGLRWG